MACLCRRDPDMEVILDSQFDFSPQVTKVVQSCFYQIRNIAKIKHFISQSDLEKVIHALVSTRLDYCNALYAGLGLKLLSRLQLVQNSAARLLTGTKKHEHITPILASLHWLPVNFRIDFKILLITFKALHGVAPTYICDMLSPYVPGRCLHSSGQSLLTVPPSRLLTRGDRAFSVRAPKLWNSLPEELRAANTVSTFKAKLKTYLYRMAFLL
ncbi:uncharacterized protein LOC121644403 [Melanotaenia boesemani]|uniref:uncharacterized protein LOC121644403 n=1 Tax=Melanotaenia boesemani TaxID=1250792 RepID=UPI001C05C6F9|nr:uncharacterized protein LOC121644403 [Melanotaenia boesemani]